MSPTLQFRWIERTGNPGGCGFPVPAYSDTWFCALQQLWVSADLSVSEWLDIPFVEIP